MPCTGYLIAFLSSLPSLIGSYRPHSFCHREHQVFRSYATLKADDSRRVQPARRRKCRINVMQDVYGVAIHEKMELILNVTVSIGTLSTQSVTLQGAFTECSFYPLPRKVEAIRNMSFVRIVQFIHHLPIKFYRCQIWSVWRPSNGAGRSMLHRLSPSIDECDDRSWHQQWQSRRIISSPPLHCTVSAFVPTTLPLMENSVSMLQDVLAAQGNAAMHI